MGSPPKGQPRPRRLSLTATSPSSRAPFQPASPYCPSDSLISSLITSLSIITSPAHELFESDDIAPPLATSATFRSSNHPKPPRTPGGSFGIDYGAYSQPSLQDLAAADSLDNLAASGPVIKTSKPPSGLSPLTAPKTQSPGREGAFKGILWSRPSSKGSVASRDRDDSTTIGTLSVEPGLAPAHELQRKKSTDSWGRKQGRAQKGLMHTASKARSRESSQERRQTGGLEAKSSGSDRLLPHFGLDSFMTSPISEETGEEDKLAPRSSFGASSASFGSNSGIGSGRFIPPRDSSLRHSKQSSHRSSRHSEKGKERGREGQANDLLGGEKDGKRDQGQRALLKDSLPSWESMPSAALASKQLSAGSRLSDSVIRFEPDEGAPVPSVGQSYRLSGQYSKSGKPMLEPVEIPQPKQSSSRKTKTRLSAPSSPKHSDDFRKSHVGTTTSPEPVKPFYPVEDRPNSADSIDDAVESYLFSPRLSQKIRHPQSGRTISFSEVGDPEGFVVFCCVGMGLTRYITAFYDELALTLKLRLITPDRPGVGDSEPYTDGTATPLSWPDDVYAICQALKVTKFSIMAHSAGAIYALATALRMPQHIRGRIHLLAPWIPPSQLTVFGAQITSPPAQSIPPYQRILRALPTPILRVANSSFLNATSSSLTTSLPKNQRKKRKSSASLKPLGATDKENFGRMSTMYPDPTAEPGAMALAANDPSHPYHEEAILAAAANTRADKERQVTYDLRLTQAIWDLATRGANPAVDLLVCLERRHTIGFRYVDITRAVIIHHGSKDSRVPVENVRWLGKTMKRCEVRVLEGEGHGLMASAAVMSNVLMEMAREWEDWVQLTGPGPKTRALRERASVGAFR